MGRGKRWWAGLALVGMTLSGVSLGAGGTARAASGLVYGNPYAWGDNYFGELGNGSNASSNTPVRISLASGVAVMAMAAGGDHSLAIGSDGKVYSWGSNNDGQLGNGNNYGSRAPAPIMLSSTHPTTTATAIAAGKFHSLAIGSDGKVYSWGYNAYGELGNGNTTNTHTPAPITLSPTNPTITATAIAAGAYDSLAIGSDGKVYSWGYNGSGQLGNGSNTNTNAPAPITLSSMDPAIMATAIAGGGSHSLAIGSDGKVYSWGYNGSGQLGNGNTTDTNAPAAIALSSTDPTISATAIAAGDSHSLAIGSDGKVYSWGTNGSGELGNGNTTDTNAPAAITLSPTDPTITATAIAAGSDHSLAIGSDGELYTWGYNHDGELGNGTNTASSSPGLVTLPTGQSAAGLGTGSTAFHTLAIVRATGTTVSHVARAGVSTQGTGTTLHWTLSSRIGVRGFTVYAGALRLTRGVIPVHASPRYRYRVHGRVSGPYSVHILLRHGQEVVRLRG